MSAAFQYPKFMMNYELRQSCAVPLLGQGGRDGILGTEAYVVVTRAGCWLAPSGSASKVQAVDTRLPGAPESARNPAPTSDHWKNFLECVKTRATPVAEIERLVRPPLPASWRTSRCAPRRAWISTRRPLPCANPKRRSLPA